jgi:hypothetical protein
MDVSALGWDSGRRASVPWNIQLGAGAGAGPFGAVSARPASGSISPPAAAASPTRRLGSPLTLSTSPLALPGQSSSSYMDGAGGGVSPRSLEGGGGGGGATDRMSVLSLDSESIAEEGETEEETVHERIERELNEIEEGRRTGVRFLRAEQGMRMGELAFTDRGSSALIRVLIPPFSFHSLLIPRSRGDVYKHRLTFPRLSLSCPHFSFLAFLEARIYRRLEMYSYRTPFVPCSQTREPASARGQLGDGS